MILVLITKCAKSAPSDYMMLRVRIRISNGGCRIPKDALLLRQACYLSNAKQAPVERIESIEIAVITCIVSFHMMSLSSI